MGGGVVVEVVVVVVEVVVVVVVVVACCWLIWAPSGCSVSLHRINCFCVLARMFPNGRTMDDFGNAAMRNIQLLLLPHLHHVLLFSCPEIISQWNVTTMG